MFLGGVWINLGPLLYHFADIPNEDSIEPSYEVVRDVIQKIGFQIEVGGLIPFILLQCDFILIVIIFFCFQKEDTNMSTTYSQNQDSMLQYEYKSVFLVCRKPPIRLNGQVHSDLHSPDQDHLISPAMNS